MNIIIADNYDHLSKKAADVVAGQVQFKPESALGLPTGSTPMGMYDELVRRHKEESLSFARVKTFNLDEYLDIDPENPGSFSTYMEENFFNHVDIDPENAYIPHPSPEDTSEECRRYEEKIKEAGGIDLIVLGVGQNGHIAFLEPAEKLPLETTVMKLADQTRTASQGNFASRKNVPKRGITMGLNTILSAERILLIANGESKAAVVEQMIVREVTTKFPVSFLHLHDDVTVILDQEAAKNI